MADLAVVALGLDATGMKQGADQATRALTGVEKEMDNAQKKVTELQAQLGTTNKTFTTFGSSAKGAASALSSLGGPVGQIAGQFQALEGQIAGLVESFGLVGGAAAAAVAGVAALGGALVKLTLDGVKISDEMGDIAEATGLTIEQMQRLQAAFGAAGENIGGIERAFAAFEQLVQGAKTGSNEAAKTLNSMKVNAQDASKNMGEAFIDLVVRLKDVTKTLEGSGAAHDAFSRQTGALIRVSGELATIMGQSRAELEKFNKIAGIDAVAAGGRLDHELNQLSQSFVIFKQNLAGTFVGRGLESYFQKLNQDLRETRTNTDLLTLAWKNLSIAGQLSQIFRTPKADLSVGPKRSLGVQEEKPFAANPLTPPKGPRDTSVEDAAKKLAEALKAAEKENADIRKKGADAFIKDMEAESKALNDLNAATAKAASELPVLKDTIVDIFKRLGIPVFAGAAAPPITAGAIPGTRDLIPLAPSDILGPREERIQKAIGGIFEDFVFQITSARSTVGDAFKGLLLGITDTFAAEFAKSMQESLQTSFIKPLASWLEDALKSIFEGIDLKGVSKFFLTLGKSFVGLFAEGGTIPPGHWGIAGERGAEVVYSGSQSMHIQPMGGGGGGVTINFAISTPTGEVSQRTQDQIADAAARGIERSQRLRGAR